MLVLAMVRTSVPAGGGLQALIDVDLQACCHELEDNDAVLLHGVALDDLWPVPPQDDLVGVRVVANLNMLVAELACADGNAPRKEGLQPLLQRSMEGPRDDEHVQVIPAQLRVEALRHQKLRHVADPRPLPLPHLHQLHRLLFSPFNNGLVKPAVEPDDAGLGHERLKPRRHVGVGLGYLVMNDDVRLKWMNLVALDELSTSGCAKYQWLNKVAVDEQSSNGC